MRGIWDPSPVDQLFNIDYNKKIVFQRTSYGHAIINLWNHHCGMQIQACTN